MNGQQTVGQEQLARASREIKNSIPSAAQIKQQSEIFSRLETMEKSLLDIREMINEVENRILPITFQGPIASIPPGNSDILVTPEPPANCTLSKILLDRQSQINLIYQALDELKQSIAL